jgi:hypothetical protein
MSDISFRPRFQFLFESKEPEIIQQVEHALKNDNPEAFHAKIKQGHFTIFINPAKKHYWSPILDLTFETTEEGQTQMRCLLAPSPSVWTLFMFCYSITIFGIFLGVMVGSAQQFLGGTAWGFYVAAVSGFLCLIFFLIAQYGKKLAAKEMKSLKAFVSAVKEKLP